MERAAWTEERLDDLAEAMRTGFSELREEMRAGFARIEGDMQSGFARVDQRFTSIDQRFASSDGEMHSGFARIDQDIRELRADMNSLRLLIMTFGGGIVVALIGVLGAILASGA